MKKMRFTLIELLVVISIIAILASLLLPALGKARDTSKRIHCADNMKNVGLGIIMYTNDWNAYIPVAWDGTTAWTKKIHADYAKGNTKLFQCPVGNQASIPDNFMTHWDKTYAIYYANASSPFYGMGSWTIYLKITQLSPPSQYVTLTDSINLDDSQLRQCYCVGCNQPWANSKIQLRHQKKSNAFFIDGHVDSVSNSFWTARINANYLVY